MRCTGPWDMPFACCLFYSFSQMVYTFSTNWGQGFQNKEHRHRNTFPKQVVHFHYVNTNNNIYFFCKKKHTQNLQSNAKFTLNDFSPIFHSPTGFDKSQTNARIRGKSVLVHMRDNRAVWIIKDLIWGHRRCVTDTREIFGMLNIWSSRRFTILPCE